MTLTQQDAVLTWNGPDAVALRGTLVLLPGRGESPQIYERFGRRLAADAYRVHVVSAPSDSAGRAHEQLVGVLDSADTDVPRVVVGSDAGAAYAAFLAAQGELRHVSALILAGLPTRFPGETFPGETFPGETFAGASSADWDAELDVRTACATHRARISDGVRPAELFSDLPDEWLDPAIAAGIAVPTLGVHGRDDVLSPVEFARSWYAAVARAELVTIAGGRHDALNDQTHRTVAAAIVQFLERLRAGSDLAPIAVTELLRAG